MHEGADTALLRTPREGFCEACHQDHSRFAHPMGSNVFDPRDPSKTLDCLSCHDAHASDSPMTLLGSADRDLCVDCHGELHDSN